MQYADIKTYSHFPIPLLSLLYSLPFPSYPRLFLPPFLPKEEPSPYQANPNPYYQTAHPNHPSHIKTPT